MAKTHDLAAFDYETRQLDRLKASDTYALKIVSDAGGETKWLNVTAAQLAEIHKILTGDKR